MKLALPASLCLSPDCRSAGEGLQPIGEAMARRIKAARHRRRLTTSSQSAGKRRWGRLSETGDALPLYPVDPWSDSIGKKMVAETLENAHQDSTVIRRKPSEVFDNTFVENLQKIGLHDRTLGRLGAGKSETPVKSGTGPIQLYGLLDMAKSSYFSCGGCYSAILTLEELNVLYRDLEFWRSR